MPPKQRITRGMILETSFSMFCREGMENVNARSVAKALGCSTQPIFSYFSGMDDLKTALESKAWALFEEEISAVLDDEKPLLAFSLTYYRFAVNQPHLFRSLFLTERDAQQRESIGMNGALRARIEAAIMRQHGVDAQWAQSRFKELRIFAHGLATLQSMDLLGETQESAEAMITDAFKRIETA